MRKLITTIALFILICSQSMAAELRRLPLDDATSIGLRIQSDTVVKAEGKGSIKITTSWPTTVCLSEVGGLDVENTKLVYAARVKSDIDGTVFLEMWAHVAGGQYFSKGMNDAVQGKSDWKTITTPFLFQKGQMPTKVTLNVVVNGIGTLWIDDIVLSKEPLK